MQNIDGVVIRILWYNKKYREVKRYKLDLPTGVQVFFLLKAANFTPDLEKLVRTTAMGYIG